jgi:hypothetical protein
MDKQALEKRVADYLEALQGIKQKVTDERTAMTILQEVNKDIRMAQIREERSAGPFEPKVEVDYPATGRQRSFLNRLGVRAPENLTKREASALIDQELAKDAE